MSSKLLISGGKMNFVPKEKSREAIKNPLKNAKGEVMLEKLKDVRTMSV